MLVTTGIIIIRAYYEILKAKMTNSPP